MPQVDDVIDAKEREEDRLLSLPGVTGVAIGLKRIGGKVTDEVAIHVYVERKLPEGELKPGDRIPPTIGGHKTDVIETGPIVEAKALQPGAQIASTWLLGTIACFVQGTVLRHDGERLLEEPLNGKRFLVTCAHVTNQENGCVYHPGLPHFGFTDLVATVSAEVYRGSVDAALCQLKDGWDFKNDIPEIGPIKGRLTRRLTKENVRSPYRVRKFGRTTEYTESTIDAVEALVKITESGRLLHSMLMISPTTSGEPFADAGDSGSPVVNDQGELVGIAQGLAPSKQTFVCQAADIFVQLAERMQLNSGLNPEDPRYSWVGLELAPFTQTALQSDPVIPDNLVPIYRHQSRGAPDRYSYNTDDKGDPEYKDGEEVFVAYDFGQPGTHKIYKHTAQDAHPKRYYYSTRLAGGYGWSAGDIVFYAFARPRYPAIPIYMHSAQSPDGSYAYYMYDTVHGAHDGWSEGQVAFWAYPKGTHIPIVSDNLVPIYRHQSRGGPDRYSYNTDVNGDSEYKDGEEVFVAYDIEQPGMHAIYKHTAQDAHPKRYYYSTQAEGGSGWSNGEVVFYTFMARRAEAIPIYMHSAQSSDGSYAYYMYDTVARAHDGWNEGQLAFWAYPKGTKAAGGRDGA